MSEKEKSDYDRARQKIEEQLGAGSFAVPSQTDEELNRIMTEHSEDPYFGNIQDIYSPDSRRNKRKRKRK